MQLFSADTTVFSKKNAFENKKKTPSKVAHNRPQLFFQYWPAAQTAQKQKSRTTLMKDWLFRLGKIFKI